MLPSLFFLPEKVEESNYVNKIFFSCDMNKYVLHTRLEIVSAR